MSVRSALITVAGGKPGYGELPNWLRGIAKKVGISLIAPHGHYGLARSVTRITWLHGLYDKRLRQFLLRRNGNDMPHNMTLSSQASFPKTRIFIAKMSVRFSTRLIFFARWLAPELWEGER